MNTYMKKLNEARKNNLESFTYDKDGVKSTYVRSKENPIIYKKAGSVSRGTKATPRGKSTGKGRKSKPKGKSKSKKAASRKNRTKSVRQTSKSCTFRQTGSCNCTKCKQKRRS